MTELPQYGKPLKPLCKYREWLSRTGYDGLYCKITSQSCPNARECKNCDIREEFERSLENDKV